MVVTKEHALKVKELFSGKNGGFRDRDFVRYISGNIGTECDVLTSVYALMGVECLGFKLSPNRFNTCVKETWGFALLCCPEKLTDVQLKHCVSNSPHYLPACKERLSSDQIKLIYADFPIVAKQFLS